MFWNTFHSRAEAYAHAETLQAGRSLKAWADFAREYQVYLAAGFAEREGLKLYDSAVLFGPDGLLGHYRKAHLWNQEKLWFTPGDLGFPVFETPIGRIGLLICWDIWFPEVPRLMAAQGADIICSLNNWMWTPPPLFDETGRCVASYLTMTAAHVNNVYIAAANRIGSERGRFLGCSLIAGTNGWPGGAVASAEEKALSTPMSTSAARVQRRSWNKASTTCSVIAVPTSTMLRLATACMRLCHAEDPHMKPLLLPNRQHAPC